jgi:endonuclease/exonuclease/phosphatase family metal-dependent hydrolase
MTYHQDLRAVCGGGIGLIFEMRERGLFRILLMILFMLASLGNHLVGAQDAPSPDPVRYQAPELLTFAELKRLAGDPYPVEPLRSKYRALLSAPFISNAAYYAGVRAHQPEAPGLGPFVRVVSWNIEQSRQLDSAISAFRDPEDFSAHVDPGKAKRGSRVYEQMMTEKQFLDQADIVLFQEMDYGMKRSGYRFAAKDMAHALGMNFAYVADYLEVDPVLMGMEEISFEEGQKDKEATAYYQEDPERYKGLFGKAVLSRYPIISVEAFQLFHQAYDWYWQEKKKTSFLERARRLGAGHILGKKLHREMKVGGRSFFRVDLHVPELPEQRVSVIAVHLEIKAEPYERAVQMAEILNYIKDISHPVILAGDFNSAPQDMSPTSTSQLVERNMRAPEFWLSRGIEKLSPYAFLVNTTRFISNMTKNYQNPTAPHIPVIFPNQTAELFRIIERFRFSDGGAFDFRGSRKRSAGHTGKLSNSNERDKWAYKTTFKVSQRNISTIVASYRLDWIFVKAYIQHPRDRSGSYRFSPHFGRTLNALNTSLKTPISDHDPNVVDLPLGEPTL